MNSAIRFNTSGQRDRSGSSGGSSEWYELCSSNSESCSSPEGSVRSAGGSGGTGDTREQSRTPFEKQTTKSSVIDLQSKCIVPLRRTQWHEGTYKWKSTTQAGLVVLRWVAKSDYKNATTSSSSSSSSTQGSGLCR